MRGAGGTPGGLGTFLAGSAMVVAGGSWPAGPGSWLARSGPEGAAAPTPTRRAG